MTTTPIPKATAANSKLIAATPYAQLTDRQKQYAAANNVTLQKPIAAPAPALNPRDVNGPNAPGGTSYVGSPDNTGPLNVPAGYVPPTPAPSGGSTSDSMTADERNAYTTLIGMFSDYGLESLGPTILNFIKQGYDATSISYLLKQTPEYKQRFAGNDTRVKNGLAPLSPAEYLATERAYRQALQASGLPASFYDNHADFTDYIGKDVSPAEIKHRADMAMQFVNNSDPAYINAFQHYYGAGPADVAAYMLDGQRNEALLQKQITSSQIGVAATQQGLVDPGRYQSEKYADMGVTQAQAQNGFGQVASVLPAETQIAQRFGQQYSQQDAQDEFLGGLASAQRKRKQLNDSEGALFAGQSGVGNSMQSQTTGSY